MRTPPAGRQFAAARASRQPQCPTAAFRSASQPIANPMHKELYLDSDSDLLLLQLGPAGRQRPQCLTGTSMPGAPHCSLPLCQSAHRGTVRQRGKVDLGLRLTVAGDLGRQASSVPRASRLRLRTPHPIAASRSASQPSEPPVRRATRQDPTSLSQVGTLPHLHAPLKPKTTSRFCRVPAVPSGLPSRQDLMEGLGS